MQGNKPEQTDTDMNDRLETMQKIIRIRQLWRCRPWVDVPFSRWIIRQDIKRIRALQPKIPPCEPVPYSIVGEPEVFSTMAGWAKWHLYRFATFPKDPNLKVTTTPERLDGTAVANAFRDLIHPYRGGKLNWHYEVCMGRVPQMKWDGNQWVEVPPGYENYSPKVPKALEDSYRDLLRVGRPARLVWNGDEWEVLSP